MKLKAHILVTITFVHMALLTSTLVAGDLTTVPWNGHVGAVTFTFDDALATQLTNVVPALKQRNIRGTFFIYDVSNTFTNNKAKWVAAAQDGNELANHTVTHADFSKSVNAAQEVNDMATRLRNADPSIEAVTFAYPYCAVGYQNEVGNQNIIGRGCSFGSFTPLQWRSPPQNWNNVGALYVETDALATGAAMNSINAAKNNGGWAITLHHGISGDWVSISKENLYALFDKAIQNGLWIGTYMEVAAYWRAGLTLDTVKTTPTGSGWSFTWKSPHAKMPRSVPVKIKLNTATLGNNMTVVQSGTVIAPNADGSYTIEFMKLGLTLQQGGTPPSSSSNNSSSRMSSSSISSSSSSLVAQQAYSSASIPGLIQVENYDLGGANVAFYDSDAGNSGNNFRTDDVDIEVISGNNYALGWTIAGEWLEYTVQVSSAGSYQVKARVASGSDSSAFHLELNGVRIAPNIVVPNTGSWTTYQEVTLSTNPITQGTHVLRLVIDKSYCNIDWIEFLEPGVKIIQKHKYNNTTGNNQTKYYDLKGSIQSIPK